MQRPLIVNMKLAASMLNNIDRRTYTITFNKKTGKGILETANNLFYLLYRMYCRRKWLR